MADQGRSIADIQSARNQKQVFEAGLRQDTDKVAAELQAAHVDAERLKDSFADQDRVQQTQAFPHGTVTSVPSGETMTDKIQHAQADLYSNIAEKASNIGESIKENIASADQSTTTGMRDATATAASKLNDAGSSAAEAAGGVADKAAVMYNRAKETVKGALGLGGGEGHTGGAAGYEGVVFGSDDPEYKSGGRATEGSGVTGGVDQGHKVAVEVGDQLEVVDQELESGQPATDQIMGKLGRSAAAAAATAEAPAGTDTPATDVGEGVFTPESVISMVSAAGQPLVPTPLEPENADKTRTPALTSDEAKSFTSTGRDGGQPTIASPREQPSLGEGSVGVSAGDPAGGANVVSAAKAAGRGLLETIGLGGNASASLRGSDAPAGAIDADPRTAHVAVGDFKGLKEALEGSSPPTAAGADAGSTDIEATTATAAAASDSTGASDVAPGVDTSALKDSAAEAADAAKQGLSNAASRAREGVDSAVQAAKDATGVDTTSSSTTGTTATGGGLLGGIAELVSGIATKVNLASNSEELLAGGVIPDEAAGPAAAGGATAQPAPEAAAASGAASNVDTGRVGEAATAAKDSVADAAAAARDKASDAAAAVKDKASDAAATAQEKVSGAAAAVKGKASDAAAAVQGKAGDAAEGVSSSMRVDDEVLHSTMAAQHAYDMTTGPDQAVESSDRPDSPQAAGPDSLISSLRVAVDQDVIRPESQAARASGPDSNLTENLRVDVGDEQQQHMQAMSVYGTAGRDPEQQQASLLQDAKEGFVGAYDTAAGAAASAADKVKDTAASLTGSGQQQQQPSADQHPGSASAAGREAAGGGSGGVGGGSGSAGGSNTDTGSTGGGMFASLKQGWEDLKHGGAPAPRAVSHAGETSASHDVTSNVERSKHLDQDQEKKIYDAEVYHVSPGAQSGSGAPGSEAAKAGAVAGANKATTGTVPHDKPDTYGVGADQKTRFDANKGINSGFGTGSAAPWDGRDSVKSVAELFTATGALNPQHSTGLGGIMSAEEQQALVDAATQAGALSGGRAGSSHEGGIRSWVNSMAAVWNNIGRASAVRPTGKDVPKDYDNPTQNVMIDPVRGVTKSDSPTPGHKVQMRTADQIPTGGSANDPHLLQHKVERLGKVISDTLTTSSEDAARDPDNLKGKSSDNKPDGTEYWLKHEAAEAGESLKAAPERAAGALHTAGEIVSGVAGHVGHAITHPFESNKPTQQPGADQAVGGSTGIAGESIYGVSVGGGESAGVQDLQEKRMSVWASGEDPAKKRETLGDKVIGPLIGDATDPKHAKELADSYHKYKAEKEGGVTPDSGEAPSGGSTSSGSDVASNVKEGAAAAADKASEVKDQAGAKASQLADKASEVKDQAAAKASQLADKAGAAAQGAVDSAKGLAQEAKDTARATGDVVKDEGEVALDSAKRAAGAAGDKAQELTDKTANKARELGDRAGQKADELKHRAGHKTDELRDRAAETADEAADRANRTADEARDAAGRAGEQAGATAGAVLNNVVGGAKALLGGLLGPFEKEGAFEETTAVVTGGPTEFEPLATEQMTAAEAEAVEASRASSAGAGNTGSAGAAAHQGDRGAAAPAGAEFQQGMQETKEGIKTMGQAGIDKTAHAAGTVTGKAEHLKEDMKARLQAGVDDTAHAAGLAAGHTEGAVENILEQVNAMKENVADKVADVTENIQVPPAEVPSNTEDIIRAKQQQTA